MSTLARRESLVEGTLAVAMTVLFVRVMAFLYRPVIIRMFAPFDGHDGWVGLGMAQAPATAYLIALSFTSIGFNVAISKLVAERVAVGDSSGARRVFQTSFWLMLALGAAAGSFFFVGAPLLEKIGRMSGVAYGYTAMAPAVVVMSAVAAFRGLFQGLRSMRANAVSQVLEAIARIVIGLALVRLLAPRSLSLAAAGFNLGDLAGAIASLGYLLLLYVRHRAALLPPEPAACETAGPLPAGDWRRILGMILRVGLPISLLGAAPPLMMYVDAFLLGYALQPADSGTISSVYGQLVSGLSVVWVPAVFTGALYNSLVPALAEAVAQKKAETAERYAALAYRATMLIAWPAAFGLAVLARPIYQLVFNSTAGADLLQILAVAVIPIMVQQTVSGILQGMGRVAPAVYSMLAGLGVKVVLTLLLTPVWGPSGAAWATVLGFMASAVLNALMFRRLSGFGLRWFRTMIRPALAGLVMAAGVGGLWRMVRPYADQPGLLTPGTLLLVCAGVLLYTVSLLALRVLSRDDVERLPYVGTSAAAALVRVGLLPKSP